MLLKYQRTYLVFERSKVNCPSVSIPISFAFLPKIMRHIAVYDGLHDINALRRETVLSLGRKRQEKRGNSTNLYSGVIARRVRHFVCVENPLDSFDAPRAQGPR